MKIIRKTTTAAVVAIFLIISLTATAATSKKTTSTKKETPKTKTTAPAAKTLSPDLISPDSMQQNAPSGEPSQPNNSSMKSGKGKLSVIFHYPQAGGTCGNAGLYMLTVPSPNPDGGEVDLTVSRDNTTVISEPAKVFDADVLRGDNDDLKLTVYGLTTGKEIKVRIRAFQEKDNPGDKPLYDESVKLTLKPDQPVIYAVSGNLEGAPVAAEPEKPAPQAPENEGAPEPVDLSKVKQLKMPVEIGGNAGMDANAGPDIEAAIGVNVELDGNAPPADGKTYRTTWRQIIGPKTEITGWDTPVAYFVPQAPGRYVFEYEIYDGMTASRDSATVNVAGKIHFFETPQEISKMKIGADPMAFLFQGNMLIFPNEAEIVAGEENLNQRDLMFIDVSDVKNPSPKANYRIDYAGAGVFIMMASNGSYVYVAYETSDKKYVLLAIDAANPDMPRIVGSLPLAGYPKFMSFGSGVLYVGMREAGVAILDVSNPGKPVQKTVYKAGEAVYAGAAVGNSLFLLTKTKMLFLDVSNPEKPVEASSLAADFLGMSDPVVIGGKLFIIGTPKEGSPELKGDKMPYFKVYDISDPAHPRVTGEYVDLIGMQRMAAADGDYVYLLHEIRGQKSKRYIDVYDTRDLSNITRVSRYETDKDINWIQVSGGYLVFFEDGVLKVLRASG